MRPLFKKEQPRDTKAEMKSAALNDAVERFMSDVKTGRVDLPPGQTFESIQNTLREISKEVVSDAKDPFEVRDRMMNAMTEASARQEAKAIEAAKKEQARKEEEALFEIDADQSAEEAMKRAKEYKGLAESAAEDTTSDESEEDIRLAAK